ncbi:MAG: TIR domain-containing protein [Lysobacterales bacterium]
MSESGKAVFLSYASQDAEAARRICDSLRAAGVEVWFDESELRGGDAWDSLIRRQVKECALFVPIISANTQAREEGYFRREWNLAVNRTQDMAGDRPFLLPVVIDGTSEVNARVPEKFRELQWTRLTAGEASVAFSEHVRRLMRADASPSSRATAPVPGVPSSRIPGRTRWLGAAAVVALGAAGMASWYFLAQPKAVVATAGPPDMSIAIMPFAPASTSTDDQRLAEELTQDLTTALERSARMARVVSHGLATRYKGASADPRTVGHDLNVRYLVEGVVRKVDAGVAVTTKLVETGNGAQVWSDTNAASPPLMSEGGREIVAQLTNRLRSALIAADTKRTARLPSSSASAADLVRRADTLSDQDSTLKGILAARKLLEEALRLDPSYVPALLALGYTIRRQLQDDPSADPERLIKEMDEVSARAVAADRDDPRVWDLRALALYRQMRWDGAFEANAEALRIDPYRNASLAWRAYLMNYSGQPGEALPLLEQAIALDPRSPDMANYLQFQGRAYLALGRYDEAIAACERSLALHEFWACELYLVAAYAQKGDMTKAAVAKAQLLKLRPGMSIAFLKAMRMSDNPAYRQQMETQMYAGLRKAGIPEK